MEEKQKNAIKELAFKKDFVKEIYSDRGKNYKEEKEKTSERNKSFYNTLVEENEIKFEKALLEKKIEDEKRKNLIRQIRELEKFPLRRTKSFDPTETCGLGILEELSVVELRERLEVQKKFRQEYADAKRERNKLVNEEKVEKIIQKANNISVARNTLKNKKEEERKNKKLEVDK